MAERLIVDQEDVGSSPIRIATLRGVAQPGQSSRFGTEMPLVQIQPSRPTMEGRKAGVLTRFEPGDVRTDV